jgi:CRISPR-associated protein Csb1
MHEQGSISGVKGRPRDLHFLGAQVVESPRSTANRLEATTWDEASHDQVAALAGVPHVMVVDGSGGFLTSSRLEAHRLACSYVIGRLDRRYQG